MLHWNGNKTTTQKQCVFKTIVVFHEAKKQITFCDSSWFSIHWLLTFLTVVSTGMALLEGELNIAKSAQK